VNVSWQCWLTVKRVRIKSKKWPFLCGTVLVDAPGVNDDNPARDKVIVFDFDLLSRNA
jgi:hypothetical protein